MSNRNRKPPLIGEDAPRIECFVHYTPRMGPLRKVLAIVTTVQRTLDYAVALFPLSRPSETPQHADLQFVSYAACDAGTEEARGKWSWPTKDPEDSF